MKKLNYYIVIFLFGCSQTLTMGTPLIPIEPLDNSQFINLHPHFQWEGPKMWVDYTPEVRIQIAEDEKFVNIIDEDIIGGGVNRYYSMVSLSPGQSYWWRVKLENPKKEWSGEWSVTQKFTVINPQKTIKINANDFPFHINQMLDSAEYYAKSGQTVEISFQKGNYTLYSEKEYILDLTNVDGLRIDGNGSTIILTDRQAFASLNHCRNIEIRNLKITDSYPGHALLTVTKLDPATNSVEFQMHPAFPQDLDLFFSYGGFNKRLLKLNLDCQGRFGIANANISTTTERINLGNGKYRFLNLPDQNFNVWKPGDMAMAMTYSTFMRASNTDQLVFTNLTQIDYPGAIVRGYRNTKNAFLNLSAEPDSSLNLDMYHFAGHSAVVNGKIAAWVEGCNLDLLPDDNIASVGLRTWLMAQTDGYNITVRNSGWTIEPGNWLEFYDPVKKKYLGLAKVVEVETYLNASNLQGWSVKLDRDIGTLNPAGSDYSKTTSVYSFHSNERFVFRNNRQFGGLGYGVKYYGGETALIENNYFENLAGGAFYIGKNYLSSTGFSAARITVRNNTIINCGWHSVYFPGEYYEHVRIENNLVSNARDGSGIFIRNMKNALIKGNEFSSLPDDDPCAFSQDILYNAIDISDFASVEIVDNTFNDSRIREELKKGTELNDNDFPDFPDGLNIPDLIILHPTADSYVQGGAESGINFGLHTVLACKEDADEGNIRRSYLRFDLSSLSDYSIDSVILRLKTASVIEAGDNLSAWFVSDDSWTESEITWNNRPAADMQLDSVPINIMAGEWIELNLTNQVLNEISGNKKLSLVLMSGVNTLVEFHSREAELESRPQLKVVMEQTAPPQLYTIQASSGANGSISPSGNVTFYSGSNEIFTFHANAGYKIDDVIVDGISLGPLESYTFYDVTKDRTIHVTFREIEGAGIITPEADAYVHGGTYQNHNNGASEELIVKTADNLSYTRESYLRFDLSSINYTIASAKLLLKLASINGDPTTHEVRFVSDDSWSEMTINWLNKPAAGDVLNSQTTPALNDWIEFEVTDQVVTELNGDSTISFVLMDATDSEVMSTYYSREAGEGSGPYLFIKEDNTSLKDDMLETGIKLFPNPAKTEFTVQFSSIHRIETSLFDLSGKLLIFKNELTNKLVIPVNHLEEGVYILKVWNGNDMFVEKVLVGR